MVDDGEINHNCYLCKNQPSQMTKAGHLKIQLCLIALCLPLCGFYYHYYKKNSEIDVYRLQLWTELKSHSINKEEYFRKWGPKVVEWKESFKKCELLELSVVFVCLLSGANLIIYFKNKKRIAKVNKGS